MARNRTKNRKKASAATGDNRAIYLALAGFTALAIVIVAVVALLSTQGTGDEGNFTPDEQGLVPVGSQAPEFTAETLDGESISVGGAGGEPTMLAFFWTDCPACNEEAPYISDIAREYEDLRVVMVGVDSRDGPEDVRGFVDNYDIQGPAVYDPSLAETYNVTAYPTNYFVDGGGEVVAAHRGLATREALEGWAREAVGS